MSHVTGAQDQVERETSATLAEATLRNVAAESVELTVDLTVDSPVEPLRRAIAAVRREALSAPEAYLDETVVPHGGE